MSSVLKCPVCRSMTTRSSIAFVQNRGPSRSLHFLDSPSVVVKGDASVKVSISTVLYVIVLRLCLYSKMQENARFKIKSLR